MAAIGSPAWAMNITSGRAATSACAMAASRVAGCASDRATPPRAMPTQAPPSPGRAEVTSSAAAVIRNTTIRPWRVPRFCTK